MGIRFWSIVFWVRILSESPWILPSSLTMSPKKKSNANKSFNETNDQRQKRLQRFLFFKEFKEWRKLANDWTTLDSVFFLSIHLWKRQSPDTLCVYDLIPSSQNGHGAKHNVRISTGLLGHGGFDVLINVYAIYLVVTIEHSKIWNSGRGSIKGLQKLSIVFKLSSKI